MAGSGLQEILELVYAPNAVVHMMTVRAVRAHLLVDGVLNAKPLSDALNVVLPQQPVEPQDSDCEITDAQISSEKDTQTLPETATPILMKLLLCMHI